MTSEDPPASPGKPSKSWEEIAAQASRKKARDEGVALDALVAKAAETGKEEFDVDTLLRYFYPNNLTDDEALIRNRVQSYRSDYYHSNALTLQEWAQQRDEIEAQGDS